MSSLLGAIPASPRSIRRYEIPVHRQLEIVRVGWRALRRLPGRWPLHPLWAPRELLAHRGLEFSEQQRTRPACPVIRTHPSSSISLRRLRDSYVWACSIASSGVYGGLYGWSSSAATAAA
jgi:hypothetical protein